MLFSNERDYTMIHDQLGTSKVSVRWAPRNPNIQNRQQRMESRQEILEVHNVNPEDSYPSCNRRSTHLSRIGSPALINILDQIISVFKGSLVILFHFYPNFDRTICKQTVETLIRRRVYLCPTKRTLGLYWLGLASPLGPRYQKRRF